LFQHLICGRAGFGAALFFWYKTCSPMSQLHSFQSTGANNVIHDSETLVQAIYSADHFRQQGHALIDLLADHLDAVHSQKDPLVFPQQSPEESLAFWQQKELKGEEEPLLELTQDLIARSVRTQHPRYIGHQTAVVAPLAALAGLVSDIMNQGAGVYEMGMAANAIEKIICDALCEKIGFGLGSNGLITSGGSLANLTALLTARAVKIPENVWENGYGEQKLAIMVSEEAHYCVDRAARIMGLGAMGVIKIPTDQRFKLRTELLEGHLKAAKEQGLRVFAVVGSACSTSSGSYDDLLALGDFCQQHDLWFHVDGAHGGAVLYSEQYRHLLKGVEKADSFVMDFHKMLMTPALATALLFKNGHDSYCTFHQKAQYLWQNNVEEWFNSAKRTFECTKYMMCFKVYALLQTYGEQAFQIVVDRQYNLARRFAQMIRQKPNFELAYEPESNIVCFRYSQVPEDQLDAYNRSLREKILAEGHYYMVQTLLGGKLWLRVSLMSPMNTEADLHLLLQKLENLASLKA
jgi:L-2,4-diaminobutyrate decarboxylase